MDGQENILDAIFEDDNLEKNDAEMVVVEVGEIVDGNINSETSSLADVLVPSIDQRSKNCRPRAKKQKIKRKASELGSNGTNIDRFALNLCRRLKEKKPYMVYTAVGCLGVSALRELIKEVNAVQACGGRKTAGGFRTGRGVLWEIIKTREPNAYKEIMKRAKEFEKQFKQSNIRREVTGTEIESLTYSLKNLLEINRTESKATPEQNQSKEPNSEEKRPSVHDRLRVPGSYDDDPLRGNPNEEDTT